MHRHTVSIALSLAVLVPLVILCRAEVQSGDAATGGNPSSRRRVASAS